MEMHGDLLMELLLYDSYILLDPTSPCRRVSFTFCCLYITDLGNICPCRSVDLLCRVLGNSVNWDLKRYILGMNELCSFKVLGPESYVPDIDPPMSLLGS